MHVCLLINNNTCSNSKILSLDFTEITGNPFFFFTKHPALNWVHQSSLKEHPINHLSLNSFQHIFLCTNLRISGSNKKSQSYICNLVRVNFLSTCYTAKFWSCSRSANYYRNIIQTFPFSQFHNFVCRRCWQKKNVHGRIFVTKNIFHEKVILRSTALRNYTMYTLVTTIISGISDQRKLPIWQI